ncbi:MAG: hypothetical protein C4524_12635 [Candidatus Zixiibacteriota bacterium]|nr:MAG: hypothetical protein C4524_12635 [candidate division Zixibacteria bacterium]
MATVSNRTLSRGAWYGLLAGIIFMIMEMVGAAIMGMPVFMPLRMFASVLLGQTALTGMSLGTAVFLGLIIHLLLSAVFGFIYGLINIGLPPAHRASMGSQAVIGFGYGLLLWFINFQIIARMIYPWFLETPQFMQAMMHALFYGLPLGLMFAGTMQRTEMAVSTPPPRRREPVEP